MKSDEEASKIHSDRIGFAADKIILLTQLWNLRCVGGNYFCWRQIISDVSHWRFFVVLQQKFVVNIYNKNHNKNKIAKNSWRDHDRKGSRDREN